MDLNGSFALACVAVQYECVGLRLVAARLGLDLPLKNPGASYYQGTQPKIWTLRDQNKCYFWNMA